jgi:hypothetical protein
MRFGGVTFVWKSFTFSEDDYQAEIWAAISPS